jgi:hypothetical protein
LVFIVSAERDASDEACAAAFARHEAYLAASRKRFPPAAYRLATSGWYHDFCDHRYPTTRGWRR